VTKLQLQQLVRRLLNVGSSDFTPEVKKFHAAASTTGGGPPPAPVAGKALFLNCKSLKNARSL